VLELREVKTDPDFETLGQILIEYSESVGVSVCFQKFSDELAELRIRYSAPLGRAYLAFVDGDLAGCGGVQRLEDGVCEMRRMYVRPRYRGLHLGRKIAESIISAGRELGYRKMVLDTLPTMAVAQQMYRALGFREFVPYKPSEVTGTLFMELLLT
jgi:carbonic anhydrase